MSDLEALARDLGRVERVSPAKARQILQETAEPAKQHWKAAASTGRTASDYARKITYNTYERAWGAEGEIGATLGGRGSLGILDDPISAGNIRSTPSRARPATEKFIDGEFAKRGRIVVDGMLREAGL